jgi:hypothetical protein
MAFFPCRVESEHGTAVCKRPSPPTTPRMHARTRKRPHFAPPAVPHSDGREATRGGMARPRDTCMLLLIVLVSAASASRSPCAAIEGRANVRARSRPNAEHCPDLEAEPSLRSACDAFYETDAAGAGYSRCASVDGGRCERDGGPALPCGVVATLARCRTLLNELREHASALWRGGRHAHLEDASIATAEVFELAISQDAALPVRTSEHILQTTLSRAAPFGWVSPPHTAEGIVHVPAACARDAARGPCVILTHPTPNHPLCAQTWPRSCRLTRPSDLRLCCLPPSMRRAPRSAVLRPRDDRCRRMLSSRWPCRMDTLPRVARRARPSSSQASTRSITT